MNALRNTADTGRPRGRQISGSMTRRTGAATPVGPERRAETRIKGLGFDPGR